MDINQFKTASAKSNHLGNLSEAEIIALRTENTDNHGYSLIHDLQRDMGHKLSDLQENYMAATVPVEKIENAIAGLWDMKVVILWIHDKLTEIGENYPSDSQLSTQPISNAELAEKYPDLEGKYHISKDGLKSVLEIAEEFLGENFPKQRVAELITKPLGFELEQGQGRVK